MKFTTTLLFALLLTLASASAFADLTCVAKRVVAHKVSRTCGSATIPDHASVSTNLNCDGYSITIDCDLHDHALKLSLTIEGPNGAKASVSQNTDLKLIDDSGNGVLVICSY